MTSWPHDNRTGDHIHMTQSSKIQGVREGRDHMIALNIRRKFLVHKLPVSICLVFLGVVNFHGARLYPWGPLCSVNSIPAISTFLIPHSNPITCLIFCPRNKEKNKTRFCCFVNYGVFVICWFCIFAWLIFCFTTHWFASLGLKYYSQWYRKSNKLEIMASNREGKLTKNNIINLFTSI